MSVEAMGQALWVPDLLPADKLLLVGIANHAGDGGAWPSMSTLTAYLCLSERSTQRHLANLVDLGLITVHLNAGGNRHTRNDRRTNRFDLHLPPVDNSAHGVTAVSPRANNLQLRGVTPVTPRGDKPSRLSRSRGDTAMTPEPSFEQKKNRPYANEFSAECDLSTPSPQRLVDCVERAIGANR